MPNCNPNDDEDEEEPIIIVQTVDKRHNRTKTHCQINDDSSCSSTDMELKLSSSDENSSNPARSKQFATSTQISSSNSMPLFNNKMNSSSNTIKQRHSLFPSNTNKTATGLLFAASRSVPPKRSDDTDDESNLVIVLSDSEESQDLPDIQPPVKVTTEVNNIKTSNPPRLSTTKISNQVKDAKEYFTTTTTTPSSHFKARLCETSSETSTTSNESGFASSASANETSAAYNVHSMSREGVKKAVKTILSVKPFNLDPNEPRARVNGNIGGNVVKLDIFKDSSIYGDRKLFNMRPCVRLERLDDALYTYYSKVKPFERASMIAAKKQAKMSFLDSVQVDSDSEGRGKGKRDEDWQMRVSNSSSRKKSNDSKSASGEPKKSNSVSGKNLSSKSTSSNKTIPSFHSTPSTTTTASKNAKTNKHIQLEFSHFDEETLMDYESSRDSMHSFKVIENGSNDGKLRLAKTKLGLNDNFNIDSNSSDFANQSRSNSPHVLDCNNNQESGFLNLNKLKSSESSKKLTSKTNLLKNTLEKSSRKRAAAATVVDNAEESNSSTACSMNQNLLTSDGKVLPPPSKQARLSSEEKKSHKEKSSSSKSKDGKSSSSSTLVSKSNKESDSKTTKSSNSLKPNSSKTSTTSETKTSKDSTVSDQQAKFKIPKKLNADELNKEKDDVFNDTNKAKNPLPQTKLDEKKQLSSLMTIMPEDTTKKQQQPVKTTTTSPVVNQSNSVVTAALLSQKSNKTKPLAKKQTAKRSSTNEQQLVTYKELVLKRQSFNEQIGFKHTYFSLLFLIDEYMKRMKPFAALDFNFLTSHLPKEEHSPTLSFDGLDESKLQQLCKLQSRSCGKINFYHMFNYDCLLRGYPSNYKKHLEMVSKKLGQQLSTLACKEIFLPNTNELNDQFFLASVDFWTMSEAHIVAKRLKCRLTMPYKQVEAVQIGNYIDLKVTFENDKIIESEDASPEACVNFILHRSYTEITNFAGFLHKNSVYQGSEGVQSVKLDNFAQAKNKINDTQLVSTMFVEKKSEKIMQTFNSERKDFSILDIHSMNLSMTNTTKRENWEATRSQINKTSASANLRMFKTHFKVFANTLLNTDRGQARRADVHKILTRRECSEKLKQLEIEHNIVIDKT